MRVDVNGRHGPSLAIVRRRQAGGAGLVDGQGVAERVILGVKDDGGVKVLCIPVLSMLFFFKRWVGNLL